MPLRIGFISFEYPPFHGGGIGTYAASMTRALAEAGHEVHVIANAWGEASEHEERPAPTGSGRLVIHRLPTLDHDYQPTGAHADLQNVLGQVSRRWERALLWSTQVADTLERLHHDAPLDVAEFPECFAEGYVTLRRRAAGVGLRDLPVTVHLHTPIRLHTALNQGRVHEAWFRRRVALEEYAIRHADHRCSPSESLRDWTREHLALDPEQSPCDVIPYALDFEELPLAPCLPQEAPPVLFYAGRLEPRKGLTTLVDGALPLLREHPTLTVHLVGRDCDAGAVEGSMWASLQRRLPAELRPRVHFAGLRPRDDLFERYAAATACVFPAPWDNFPNTCWEAMACGGCVVASDQGGMGEVLEHERSGLLFDPADPTALTANLRRVLQDRELTDALRIGAQRRIREVCDPARVAEARVAHYERTRARWRAAS